MCLTDGIGPRVKRCAPASFAVCVDQRIDSCVNARARERVDDEAAFPFAVGRLAIALDRAAPACAVIRAERRLAIRRRRDHIDEATGFSGDVGANYIAGNRVRDEDITFTCAGETLAALTEPLDRQHTRLTHL